MKLPSLAQLGFGSALILGFFILTGCPSPASPSKPAAPAPAPETFTVTYNANGATGGSVPVDGTSYTLNGSFTVLGNTGALVNANPFATNFSGWTNQAGNIFYPTGQTVAWSSSNVTLYAAWGGTVGSLALVSATFNKPLGIAINPVGTDLYVADTTNNQICQVVIASGATTTLAGSTTSGFSDGTGPTAGFAGPAGVAAVGTNVYVADTNNNTIRQVVIAGGATTTLAGSSSQTQGSTNGTGSTAKFYGPTGIVTDGTNLYIADTRNNMIRQVVIGTGATTTVAGSTAAGSSDGTPAAARFSGPTGLAYDSTGPYLYVADTGNNLIRKITMPAGVVTTIAGSTSGGYVNDTGTAASFLAPGGLATDGTNLYVADTNNFAIRKIVLSTGVVSTIAGSPSGGSANGVGLLAGFNLPFGIVLNGTTLYVLDSYNNKVRTIQ